MKKCISCLMIVILLVFAEMLCMAEGDNDTELAVIDGQLTFSCFVDAPVGTPVSVFIMPRVLSGGEDVTVESVNMVNTTDAFGLLNIDYMSVIKVSDNNRIELYCNMNETLPTGICHIILNHINSNGAYVAASFEHVSKNDISELVNAFNASEQTKYKEIILADCNGENDAPAKEILRKSSANVEYYKTAEYRLTELESTYQEKLRLQAPAEYWKKLKGSYQLSGWGWLILSGLIAAGIIAFLCIVLFKNNELLTENANWIDNVKSSAILTVITSIAVYILRLTSKMSLSSFHLSKDAKERESLAYFYLSLMEKSAVTEKERAIILNALFSRSDTGLLKGDSAPTMSSNVSDLVELFKKTQN